MEPLNFSIIILLLSVAIYAVGFTQNANATVPIVQIIIPNGANSPNCANTCFVPNDITIARGTAVEWINRDVAAHAITSGQPSDATAGTIFDSGLVGPGQHFLHNFNDVGVFKYFDQVHPWDTGVIRVAYNVSGTVPVVITVSTDKSAYFGGDTITVTGATNTLLSNSNVLITIKDPQKNIIITTSVPLQQNSNSYLAAIMADNRFSESGTYEIEAKYGDAQYQSTFDFSPRSSAQKVFQVTSNGNLPESKLLQGQSTQLTVNFKLDKIYNMESMDLSLGYVPDGVEAWVNPERFDSIMNSNHTMDIQIPIYVNSGAKPGNYTIDIIGNGDILNVTSNKEIPFIYQKIASIDLTIKPDNNPLAVDIGQPDSINTQFCTDTDSSGQSCEGFVSHQEFPITVYSENPARVKLDALKIPTGGYVKFIPDDLNVDKNGSAAKMILAGVMRPFIISPFDTQAMVIQATSSEGNTAAAFLPVISSNNITILALPGSITPPSNLQSSGSQTGMITFGVVYEPATNSTLAVKLEPLGMVNETTIMPFPSWFSVKIPRDSFVLNASQPYYFMTEFKTSNVPDGKITFALGEDVGGQHFVQDVTINIANVMLGPGPGVHEGLAIGEPRQLVPSTCVDCAAQHSESNGWSATVVIGGTVAGGAGAISFYVLRKKPS